MVKQLVIVAHVETFIVIVYASTWSSWQKLHCSLVTHALMHSSSSDAQILDQYLVQGCLSCRVCSHIWLREP